MTKLLSFFLILIALATVFGWHVDSAGNVRDFSDVIAPFTSFITSVSEKAQNVINSVVKLPAEYVEPDSELHDLYAPFYGKHHGTNVSHVAIYLYSVEIMVSGSWHRCYVLYASSDERGDAEYNHFVVQDLDKTEDDNLQGWYFTYQFGGWLFDNEGLSNLPWRAARNFVQTSYTIADLTGVYWTPEGLKVR